jgi:hypothetical protein
VNVTFIARTPCHMCGHENKTFTFAAVRVNKRSLVTSGPSMVFADRECAECGAATPSAPCDQPTTARLIPEDQERVAEYRARRFKESA